MKAMRRAARDNEAIAARVRHFVYRTKEELYDYENDPNSLHNLIDDPKYVKKINELRLLMTDEMETSGDPAYAQFTEEIDL